jgi:uncharacterized protein (DUF427 family)
MPDAIEDADVGVVRPDFTNHIRVEQSPRRVRAFLNHVAVADSKRALLLLERGHLPVYYFPPEDVRMELLEPTPRKTHCPYKGEASYWTVKVGDRTSHNTAWGYLEPLPERTDIKGYIAFYWNRMDAWYEEDDEVFVHARDPYHRLDVLDTSRHIKVSLHGEPLAETRSARVLFETGLPPRWYIPLEDVREDLLTPSEKRTGCAYKGFASYWSVRVGDTLEEDLVWTYREPRHEVERIAGYLAFFNERTDIEIDGELTERPLTPWSPDWRGPQPGGPQPQ